MSKSGVGESISVGGASSELRKLDKKLEPILGMYKASQSLFWKIIAIVVVLATITSAVFEALSYFRG